MSEESIEIPTHLPIAASNPFARFAIALAFLFAVMLGMNVFFGTSVEGGTFLMIAAVVGGYMAMNIGANDVANNVGPTVGSGAMTMGAAIVLAAAFEFGGAVIAGGEVVGTVKGHIIDPQLINDDATFVWLMFAALFARGGLAEHCNLSWRAGFDNAFDRRRGSGRGHRRGRLECCQLERDGQDRR